MSELERLIEYLEGNLTISEPTMAYSLHNNEVAGYIEFLESLKQPTLNENQQEVLEWLQAYGDKDGGDKPFQTIFYISECLRTGRLDYSTLANLSKLNRKQQAQVLQLFANWVLDQEEE